LLDPPAVLAIPIGRIALLDSIVTSSIRHQIVTIGHPVTHVTTLSHQDTVASSMLLKIARIAIKIGPQAIQIDPVSHKVTNQVVTTPMLLVTTKIGLPPVVVTPVTGPPAVQIVRAISKGLIANKILVTNIGIEAVLPTVTDHKPILVTVSLGKITQVTISKIGITIGHRATAVTVPVVTQGTIYQARIVPQIISQAVTNFAQSV
jgi:hypothetical protein